jgi:hypothetical protein
MAFKHAILIPIHPPAIHPPARFATYNYLNATLPQYDELPKKLARSAVIGFAASAISDTCSNSIRVVKTVGVVGQGCASRLPLLRASSFPTSIPLQSTLPPPPPPAHPPRPAPPTALQTRQTAAEPMSYPQVVRSVVARDGLLGLFGRGLKTKIISNGMQGLLFSVLWRLGQDAYAKREAEGEAKAA